MKSQENASGERLAGGSFIRWQAFTEHRETDVTEVLNK